ncbi:MAG: GxxExxY protein [Calditrichaceae bacterium]|nr:GxxExxY protein [Calditrichaceae bacterium]
MENLDEINKITHKTIKVAIEVHKHLGLGFLESVYEDALCIEFDLQGIAYERQTEIDIFHTRIAVSKDSGWICW